MKTSSLPWEQRLLYAAVKYVKALQKRCLVFKVLVKLMDVLSLCERFFTEGPHSFLASKTSSHVKNTEY